MDRLDAQRIKRFVELYERARTRDIAVCSEFLTLHEQDLLSGALPDADYVLTGGYESAQRKIAVFGEGPQQKTHIVCIKAAPTAKKFSDALTHRDFLGALIGLGIGREVVGDILAEDNCAWLFCLPSIAPFILEEFSKVKHTPIRCALSEVPVSVDSPEQSAPVVVSSLRLDTLIAAVYHLSRSASRELIEKERVFINGRLVSNTAAQPKAGQVVSVRGHGKFRYEANARETKKGRLRVDVAIFK